MEKAYLEMMDVMRAELTELYRLRREDAGRLQRLEAALHFGRSLRPRPGRCSIENQITTSDEPKFLAALVRRRLN